MWYGQAEDSNRVCAWGILENPHEHINCLRHHHGSQKGKLFHIWADRVRSVRLSDDTWLVRFDKWERSGELLYVLTFELRRIMQLNFEKMFAWHLQAVAMCSLNRC
jgi:hypothetical protein